MNTRIGHAVVFGTLELVCLDDTRWFVVDRARQELRSLDVPCQRMPLSQRQAGQRSDGGQEILECYETEDGSESIMLDSSPDWLDQLRNYDAMFFYASIK